MTSELTREQIEELYERSKDDRAIIVGSEVRQLASMALDRLTSAAPAEGVGMREKVLRILDKHQRHVELSPGVGIELQMYAIACIDDIENDIRALPIDAATEQWVCVPRKLFASSAELASDAYNLNWSKGHDGDVVWQRVWDALLAAQSSPQKTGDKS